ncbi:MAG: hypothetical protein P8J33_08165 [Pirellulaceae bacterium]|nr:hypothetical protein [Pirellulaceae bacterium]
MTGTYNEIRCPKCEASIFVYAEQAGDQIGCPRCQNEILVPGAKPGLSPESSVDDLIDLDSSESPLSEGVSDIRPISDPFTAPDKADDFGEFKLAADPEDGNTDAELEFNQDLVEQSAEDSGDDFGELISNPETKFIQEAPDAFEVDDNKPLEVAGVTPADGQFGVVCHLCGSLLYGRVSQVGTKIKCHDCHSMVEVPQPKVDPTPVAEEQVETETDEDAGYRLSEPVDLQPLETTFDISLGEIDYEDDEFFEKRRQATEQATEQTPDPLEEGAAVREFELIPEIDRPISVELPTEKPAPNKERFKGQPAKQEPKINDEDEYNLLPVPEKSSGATSAWGTQSTNISEPVSIDQEKVPPVKSPQEKRRQPKKKSPAEPLQQSHSDIPSPFSDFSDWLKNVLAPVKDRNGLLRIALATGVMGVCYWLILGGCANFTEDSKTIEKFVGFAFVAMGGVPLCLTLFVLGVYSNSVIRVAMEGRGTLAEWPDFSIADWISQFVFVGTSFWIAAVPGVIIGTLLSLITQNSLLLFCCIILSALTLTPFILASVVFNGSPAAVMTTAVFQSFQVMQNRWLRFFGFALAVGLWLSLSIVALSFLVAGPRLLVFVIAALQVSALLSYWWVLGDHIGQIVRWLGSD